MHQITKHNCEDCSERTSLLSLIAVATQVSNSCKSHNGACPAPLFFPFFNFKRFNRISERVKVNAIRNLGVSPDDRLNHVRLRLGIQLGDVRERRVVHVVLAPPLVVSIVVTLLAIADRMIPVVTRALGREAHADRRFVRCLAILTNKGGGKKLFSREKKTGLEDPSPCSRISSTLVAWGVKYRRTFDWDEICGSRSRTRCRGTWEAVSPRRT